jgi:competence protein ComEC
MLLSDADDGNSGGATALLATLPTERLMAASVIPGVNTSNAAQCAPGQSWVWDGVRFDVLAPLPAETAEGKARTNSCVVRVSGPNGSLLLPANIERKEQAQLVASYGAALASDVLVMPHHGAAGAWSADFLDAVKPRLAVASVGYLNPYRQPRQDVVAAYRARDVAVCRTDLDGAITIDMGMPAWKVTAWRASHARYWQITRSDQPCADPGVSSGNEHSRHDDIALAAILQGVEAHDAGH